MPGYRAVVFALSWAIAGAGAAIAVVIALHGGEAKAQQPAPGLATAAQVEQVRQDLQDLRSELRGAVGRIGAVEIEQARQQGARSAVARERP